MQHFRRRLIAVVILLIFLFGSGTLGYIWLEGWSWLDAFYMTTISLTTVGFGEVQPLSSSGRLFTIVLILLGVGVLTYSIGSLVEYVLAARVGIRVRKRRMVKEVSKYRNHVIVCGYGRVGQSAIAALSDQERDIVIIEKNPIRVEKLMDAGFVVVEGDATIDEVLLQAGMKQAWGMLVATEDDSVNLFIVLSARALNADIFIVTRSNEKNEQKMIRAGANRTVSPFHIGGRHMANIITRPQVTDFFDVVTLAGGVELWIEEIGIGVGSILAGKTVGEANIRRRAGVTLVALIRRKEDKTLMPDADTMMKQGDELIVLGTREQLLSLKKLANLE